MERIPDLARSRSAMCRPAATCFRHLASRSSRAQAAAGNGADSLAPRSRFTINQGGELMITALTGRLAAAAWLVFLLVLSPARAADPPGVLWDTTSQVAMAG